MRDHAGRRDAVTAAAGLGATAVVILILRLTQDLPNPTIAALLLLLVILATATAARMQVAIAISVVAMLAFNFFLLPPFHTFALADPQNWVALFVFLAVAIVASRLSAAARSRTLEAVARRNEVARLFDLSRDVLVMTESRAALAALARSIARRFDLTFVAVALPRPSGWDVVDAGSATYALETRELSSAFAAAQTSLEFDAYARTYAGHRTVTIDGTTIRIVPLRVGTKPIGLLAAAGRPIEAGTLDALAGVVAIAIERAQFLEERKTADLTRRSEELKGALLASLGHDLRTPLTAIRVAATNMGAEGLTPDERREQGELILAEVERLTRLFEDILAMTRIDAGAVVTASRWAHPSEIVSAAREQVAYTLRHHCLEITTDPDVPVRLDPRVTATALAHLLENAAQYAPEGSTIHVDAGVTEEGLTIRVRDRGPGIAPADLPHLFERFYRGAEARHHVSGTGLGLSIARGLLAVERGRIWAENGPEGGAQFTIHVPGSPRDQDTAIDSEP